MASGLTAMMVILMAITRAMTMIMTAMREIGYESLPSGSGKKKSNKKGARK